MTSTPATAPVAETLANFASSIRPGELPPRVAHEAKRSLLNFVGGAVGVAYAPVVETAVRVLEPFAGSRLATLIGRHERLDPLSASFVNAISANLLDYDDTHLRTVIHPTAPVAPPVLALAEARGFSGAAALTAFALGAEIECRIGNMVTGGHYGRGWHITATCGVFGSALAAAHLLQLPPAKIAHALGIAASGAAGIVENLPTEAKNVGMGNAARGGLLAALLAAEGYDAAPRAIEGPLGWARAAGDEPSLEEIVGELGQRWELLQNTYKPYPAGIVMHAIIDACLDLKAQHGIEAAEIASVTVTGDRLLLARGDRQVRNEKDARVSIHYSVAAPFLWGRFGVGELEPAKVMSPEAAALRAKVKAERDDRMPQGAARVAVRLASGAVHEMTVDAARGSIQKPMSDGEIEAKVRDLVRLAGTDLDADHIIGSVWGLDQAASVTALMASTVARKA
jgi:2-methylcitrate dehydratase PrpD